MPNARTPRIAKCSHGSVHAAKKELLAKKKEQERIKQEDLDKAMKQNPAEDAVAEMQAKNVAEDAVTKFQESIEKQARDKVREIQGVAYETVD